MHVILFVAFRKVNVVHNAKVLHAQCASTSWVIPIRYAADQSATPGFLLHKGTVTHIMLSSLTVIQKEGKDYFDSDFRGFRDNYPALLPALIHHKYLLPYLTGL